MKNTLFRNIRLSLFCIIVGQVFTANALSTEIGYLCSHQCTNKMPVSTGLYILEHGEESLMSRAWLAQHARKSIDVQYFIWSTDNIGILAGEALLSAADRGVKVRVIVDDLLIDARDETLLALDAHPNVDIKIYNPQHSVGISWLQRIVNVVRNFRGVNQRMHDKTVIFDNIAGITGGRNMADEYFDYDRQYNFRDRDILLVGKSVNDMTINFNEFWESSLSVPVDKILGDKKNRLSHEKIQAHWAYLHAYAGNNENFEPEVRQSLAGFAHYFATVLPKLVWDDARFLSDVPGKNNNTFFLDGGSEITKNLTAELLRAKTSIDIESPYLVLPDEALDLFASLIRRGVKISIVTNSLASTDNLMAYSGYHNQREALVDMGIDIYEFKPHPQIQKDLVRRYPRLSKNNPVFALHAKSMVIDGKVAYIGTFNLDPRSMHLNTEVGVLVNNRQLAQQLQENIRRDMRSGNSWHITNEYNADDEVAPGKRLKLWFYKVLPMQAVL